MRPIVVEMSNLFNSHLLSKRLTIPLRVQLTLIDPSLYSPNMHAPDYKEIDNVQKLNLLLQFAPHEATTSTIDDLYRAEEQKQQTELQEEQKEQFKIIKNLSVASVKKTLFSRDLAAKCTALLLFYF
jgi:hypothetical protein